jgi:hypothetical protein
VCSWDRKKWLNHFPSKFMICKTPRVAVGHGG